MAYELGGRAGKSGDNYERNYVISLLLEIVQEKINGIKFEPLGDEESGTDVVIYNKNGSKLFAQCKGRNGSTEYWTAASLRDIFAKMVRHLERDDTNEVALVTPLNCTMLEDLIKRAKTNDGNQNDFYNSQILTSPEMEKFYQTLCNGYELRGIPKNELDIIKSISYLSRTQFWQMPDTSMKKIIKEKIEVNFLGDSEIIISQLQDYVINSDIFGNKITIYELDEFFKTRGIEYRNLSKNPAIFPKIQELNQLFWENNSLINNSLIERTEMLKCFEHLLNDQSIVIHGKAGIGKTGCVKGIIEQCKHKRIPYLAVSLDSYTEVYNSEQLGELLGLPASPVFCLDSISRESKAVLLLDQLDALRWTQSHSQAAINTCKQLIKEVESLNKDREQKIIIAFVCRTYDLKNDTQIQSLFNKENAVFQEVEISELASNILEELVGEEYQNLSNKQRELLRVPVNLYIWKNIENETRNTFIKTSDLVEAWLNDIEKKYQSNSIADIKKQLFQVVDVFEKKNTQSVSINLLNDINNRVSECLITSGVIQEQNKRITFVHQLILDDLIGKRMMQRYENGEGICEILGHKNRQTPQKRYQLQCLLENIIEQVGTREFLQCGDTLFKSDNVRYYNKFLFFEILNVTKIDRNIKNFILGNLNDDDYFQCFKRYIFLYNATYSEMLFNAGVIKEWLETPSQSEYCEQLLVSVRDSINPTILIELSKYVTNDQMIRFLPGDIAKDTDDLFTLRCQLYLQREDYIPGYIDFKKIWACNPLIAIDLILVFWQKEAKDSFRGRHIDDLFLEDVNFDDCEYPKEIINKLLPIITLNKESGGYYRWGKSRFNQSLERSIIEVLKAATKKVIENNSKDFYSIYSKEIVVQSEIINEIILTSLLQIPANPIESTQVINYIIKSFPNVLFDKTSGESNQLTLVRQLLSKHCVECTREIYLELERKIIYFSDKGAVSNLKWRIEYNKQKANKPSYAQFWGDLQLQLLSAISYNVLTIEGQQLLIVLQRRNMPYYLYKNSNTESGWVRSPVSGKELTLSNWKGIITNDKIEKRSTSRWKETEGGYIDSSLQEFASSFRNFCEKNLVAVAEMLNSMQTKIPDQYIDVFFSVFSSSSELKNFEQNLIESLILTYCSDLTGYRAKSVCEIFIKVPENEWTQELKLLMFKIATTSEKINLDRLNKTDFKTCQVSDLNVYVYNSSRSLALSAIANLIYYDEKNIAFFKAAIMQNAAGKHPLFQYASLTPLVYVYTQSNNLDLKREAAKIIIAIYQRDIRAIYVSRSTKLLIWEIYYDFPEYQHDICSLVINGFCYATDNEVQKVASYCLTKMYLKCEIFDEYLEALTTFNEVQAKAIIEILVDNIKRSEVNEKVEKLFNKLGNSNFNFEREFYGLFDLDSNFNLKENSQFVKNVLFEKFAVDNIYRFVEYLEKSEYDILDYEGVIFNLCDNAVSAHTQNNTNYRGREIEKTISNLIISLYNEALLDNDETIIVKCLDMWDRLFKADIGQIRSLSKKIQEL